MPKTRQLSRMEQDALNQLSDKELLFILRCENFKEIEERFKAQAGILRSAANKRSGHARFSSNRISEALVDSLNPVSYGFLMIDGIFTLLASIAFTPFMAIGAVMLSFFAVVGIVHFVGMYKDIKKSDEKNQRYFQLLTLQDLCADLYLKRHNVDVSQLNKNNQEYSEKLAEKINKKKWQRARDALGTWILVAGSLFYTYYAITLAFTIAFASAAFVGVMTGGIGIGIALGAAFLIGAYFCYRKYALSKKNQTMAMQRKEIEHRVNEKYDLCRKTHKINKHSQNHPRVLTRRNSDSVLPSPSFDNNESGLVHTIGGTYLFRRLPLSQHEDDLPKKRTESSYRP